MGTPSESAVLAYIRFFETLTDASVEEMRRLAAPNVRYRDPLIDSQGIDAVVASMHKWFHDMDGIRFELGDFAQTGSVVLSHWYMHFRVKKMPKRQWKLEGMSRVTFDASDKVVDQVDYWDATPLLESVPLLGRVVGLVRKVVA